MTTLSNGAELTIEKAPPNPSYSEYYFYLTPPGGGTPEQFGSTPGDFYGGSSIESVDVFDGFFTISYFTTHGKYQVSEYLNTEVYTNDGALVRTLNDEAAIYSGEVMAVEASSVDDVTVTWTRANPYGAGNTQYGDHQVIVDDGAAKPDTFVNHAPIVGNMSFTLAPGQTLNDVEFSNKDPDYDLLNYVVVDGPDHGTLTQSTAFQGDFYPFREQVIQGSPQYHFGFLEGNLFDYAPDPGFVGTDTFKVYGNDGQADSTVATISVTVSTGSQAQYFALTDGPDTVRYFASNHPVFVAAKGGNDDISGSRFDDSLNGGTGNDVLRGESGRDTLTGGQGVDRMLAGAGNDTFNFVAGDLADPLLTPGSYDQILDFHGAGRSASGEQDFLRFSGFGDDATLTFVRYGNTEHTRQLYAVNDPDNPDTSGFIHIQMAGGANLLGPGDYAFL